MKKFIFILLVSASIISCSDDQDTKAVEAESVDAVELQKYDDLFEKYTYFKNDGKLIDDKNKIVELLSTAEITLFNPKHKQISFYSSKDKFKEITNVDPDRKASGNAEGYLTNSTGQAFSDDGYFEGKGDNTNAKSSLIGINGLGTIGNDSYFLDFANKVFFTTEYFSSGNTYFSEAGYNSNLRDFTVRTASIRNNTVRSGNLSMGIVFENYFLNRCKITVHNDTDESMYIWVYEENNYAGRAGIIALYKDEYEVLSESLSSWNLSAIKSIKVFDLDALISGNW
jgi:hypothetical protein